MEDDVKGFKHDLVKGDELGIEDWGLRIGDWDIYTVLLFHRIAEERWLRRGKGTLLADV